MVEKQIDVAIIDYGISNLFSVKRACDLIDLDAQITSSGEIINSAKSAILPGVGAFPYAMEVIKQKKLDITIKDFIQTGKPLLGICLGMQLLMDSSIEFYENKGLGVISGTTKKFKLINDKNTKYPVPQIGWNKIFNEQKSWENTILENNSNEDFMYFVHSYYILTNDDIILSKTKPI